MTTPACPEYRLRLFLSVDLVGSTAFKAGRGADRLEKIDPYPIWVTETRKFYREFPAILASRYEDAINSERVSDCHDHGPQLWKTIGDEIIFCNRANTVAHLACCLTAFVRALAEYGRVLVESGGYLDVKGTAWVASFPSPNVTVEIAGRRAISQSDYTDEDFEVSADKNPSNFDFLGKDIDAGFRITKHSQAERLAISAELAYLLCEAEKIQTFREPIEYLGRDVLKGVMNGRPYPVVVIDTEKKHSRKEIRELEKAITKQERPSSVILGNFLRALLVDEGLDLPFVPDQSRRLHLSIPGSYLSFQEAWRATVVEVSKRSQSEDASRADSADSAVENLPQEISDQLDGAMPARDVDQSPRQNDSAAEEELPPGRSGRRGR